jgi:hypothetical protein
LYFTHVILFAAVRQAFPTLKESFVKKQLIGIGSALLVAAIIWFLFSKLIIAVLFGGSLYALYNKKLVWGGVLLALMIGLGIKLWVGIVILTVIAIFRKQIVALEANLTNRSMQ